MLALVLELNRYFEIPLSVQSGRGFRGGGGALRPCEDDPVGSSCLSVSQTVDVNAAVSRCGGRGLYLSHMIIGPGATCCPSNTADFRRLHHPWILHMCSTSCGRGWWGVGARGHYWRGRGLCRQPVCFYPCVCVTSLSDPCACLSLWPSVCLRPPLVFHGLGSLLLSTRGLRLIRECRVCVLLCCGFTDDQTIMFHFGPFYEVIKGKCPRKKANDPRRAGRPTIKMFPNFTGLPVWIHLSTSTAVHSLCSSLWGCCSLCSTPLRSFP